MHQYVSPVQQDVNGRLEPHSWNARLVDPPPIVERHHVGRKDAINGGGSHAATPW
jgi:hypothetical protein